MGKVVPIEDPSNYEAVTRRIRRLLEQGDLEIRPHAILRMRERKYLIGDVKHVLRFGTVVNHRLENGAWRWKVRGVTVERKSATCVVEIDGLLIVVTII